MHAAIQEDADGIAVSSYQGGHNEYFRYMVDMLKSEAMKIHGDGHDATEAERLAAWEKQTAARELTVLSGVHQLVRGEMGRPGVVITDDLREMAARAAVAEVQKHHSVWSLSELRFEVARALPPGASAEDVRQVADLAVTPGSGCDVLLVTAPEVADVSPLGTRRDGTSIYRPPNEGPVHHQGPGGS